MSDRRRRRKNRTSSKASEAPSEPKKEEEPKNEIKLDDKIEEKEEEPEIKPEEIPLIPNSLKMDILLSTASMQHQNGLRAGDYLRYAHFCRKKIQKLRKMNHLSQGKRKFQKVENIFINPVRHIRRALAKHLKTKKYVTVGGKK